MEADMKDQTKDEEKRMDKRYNLRDVIDEIVFSDISQGHLVIFQQHGRHTRMFTMLHPIIVSFT